MLLFVLVLRGSSKDLSLRFVTVLLCSSPLMCGFSFYPFRHPFSVRLWGWPAGVLVHVTDHSAYGTYLKRSGTLGDGNMLTKGEAVECHEGDCLAFGAPVTWYCLSYHRVRVYPSDLQARSLKRLASHVRLTGFELAEEFDTAVTHIVTDQVERSSDVFLALVRSIHVVSPFWFNALCHVVEKGSNKGHGAIPPAKKYLPDWGVGFPNLDQSVLLPNERRNALFSGMHLAFVGSKEKPLVNLSKVVRDAEGRVEFFHDMSSIGTERFDLLVVEEKDRHNDHPHGVQDPVVGLQDVEEAILHADVSDLVEMTRSLPALSQDKSQNQMEVDSDAETEDDVVEVVALKHKPQVEDVQQHALSRFLASKAKATKDNEGVEKVRLVTVSDDVHRRSCPEGNEMDIVDVPDLEEGDLPGFFRRRRRPVAFKAVVGHQENSIGKTVMTERVLDYRIFKKKVVECPVYIATVLDGTSHSPFEREANVVYLEDEDGEEQKAEGEDEGDLFHDKPLRKSTRPSTFAQRSNKRKRRANG